MSTFVLTDSKIVIDGTNLSAWLIAHDLPQQNETQDATAMTATTRTYKSGLKNHQLTVEFFQDFAAGGPDGKLATLYASGASFAVTLKTSSGANAATNPEMQGNFIVESYDPMSGSLGGMLKCRAVLKPAGALTRATA